MNGNIMAEMGEYAQFCVRIRPLFFEISHFSARGVEDAAPAGSSAFLRIRRGECAEHTVYRAGRSGDRPLCFWFYMLFETPSFCVS
jgi:hypothetical protein